MAHFGDASDALAGARPQSSPGLRASGAARALSSAGRDSALSRSQQRRSSLHTRQSSRASEIYSEVYSGETRWELVRGSGVDIKGLVGAGMKAEES